MRIFVAWDTTAQALKTCLEGLRWGTTASDFVVPGLTARGGEILRDIVIDGISSSDRALVFVDRPNANVAFEAGLALGLGKPLALVQLGNVKPPWLDLPPFANLLVHHVQGASDIEAAVDLEDLWTCVRRGANSTQDTASSKTLFLCPTRSEGESCRRVQQRVQPVWKQVPATSFSIRDLPDVTRGIDRIVWTITQYNQGADERDGAENASAAVIAGWFIASRFGRRVDDGLSRSKALLDTLADLRVLRSRTAREVVDVQLIAEPFGDLSEYARLIVGPQATDPGFSQPSPAATTAKSGGVQSNVVAHTSGLTEVGVDEWELVARDRADYILALFVVPWSKPCAQMAAVVQSLLPELPPLIAAKVVVQSAGAVSFPVVMKQFPTLLLLANNTVRLQVVGNRQPATLKQSILKALSPT